jgi:DNA-binding NarL/FixJ family response regulator
MNTAEKIKLLLADDYAPMRHSLRRYLSRIPGMEVVGEADDGRMAIELTQRLLPDIVIMDVNMPTISGSEATRQITTAFSDVKVIAFTSSDEGSVVKEMLEAGASAFLVKGCDIVEIVSTIKAVTEDSNHG